MILIQMMPWKGGRTSFMKFHKEMCTRITTEVREEEFGSYQFDGSDLVDAFIAWMQHIPEHHRVCTLDTMLIGIPVQMVGCTSRTFPEWEVWRFHERKIQARGGYPSVYVFL
jgi:hypothetical protein